MSLLKRTEKNPAPSSMTAVGKVQAQLDEVIKDTEAAAGESQKRILALNKQKAELKKVFDDRAGRIRVMAADYKKALSGIQVQESAAIAAASIVKGDLDAGRVSVSEFLRVGKKAEEIEAEAAARAREKLSAVRDSARVLMLEQYKLNVEIAGVEEKISSEFSFVAGSLWHKLDSMKRALESRGITASGIQTAHYQKAEADNNLGMARSGSTIYHGKQWKVESVEDVRLLILDPIVQIVHLEELEALARDLEGRDFPLTVNYLPNAAQGRGPGFWFYPKPKIQEVHHG